jgi:hypothetical protein
MANGVLHLIDGRTERTYGNTCSNTSIGDGDDEESMQPVLEDLFVAARGGHRERAAPQHSIDVSNIGCLTGDGRTFGELTDMVAAAAHVRGWAVIMIHGVGEGTHDWWLNAAVHGKFVDWLSDSRDTVWTAPVVEVGSYVRRHCMAQPPSTTSD